MKYKVAICKIRMIGDPCLIAGICRYDDDDSFWQLCQYFTMENYLHVEFKCNPDQEWSMCKSQEEADKLALEMRKAAQERAKYHVEVIHFDSINKDVKVFKDQHSFDLGRAEPLELTKEELALLTKEMNGDGWEAFDDETWGK